MPDYPGAPGRTGYAVGLDVPASVIAMLHDLKKQGYAVDGIPESPRKLLDLIEAGGHCLSHDDYAALARDVPAAAREAVEAAWGTASESAFPFRAASFGNVTVALAPDRGRSADRRADYHDPTLPPRHALLAFGLWLRQSLGCHAIIHVGAHGTLEWLPGKTVALSSACFPEIVTGSLPVIYPFIVSNPGEAAQAKRRIAAVTLGHLPPPLVDAGLDENQQKLERLVDEYAQADGLDRRRRDRLAKLIVETASQTGLAAQAGVGGADAPDEALRRIDAWLCDLKDFAIKDGLHVYGRAAEDESDPLRQTSATAERDALIAALDGRHVAAGPSGAPARGRTDVLPTGRNLFTADPRTMPTPTAFELGQAAADEVLRRYMQDHGDWPRSLVIDLWGSASLRTGGEEIAQGLALMGCRPQWDSATGRVTGIEVLPPATVGRPRVDVTWRISGLFRDMFPTQIALIDAAAAAVARRDEDGSENPLAQIARADQKIPSRIFGSSPGTYGAGLEDLLSSGNWESREELGRAYLDVGVACLWRSRRRRHCRARGVCRPHRRSRPPRAQRRRPRPRYPRRFGRCRLHRRLFGSDRGAWQECRRHRARHDRPAKSSPPLDHRGCQPCRAGARHQSAFHRGPVAPRPARRIGIRRDGGSADWFCRDDQRHPRRADRGRA